MIDTVSLSVKAVVPLTTEFATLGQLVTALSDGSGRIVVTDLYDAAIADPATGSITPLDELALRNPSDLFMGAVALGGGRFVVQHYSGTLTVFDADGHVLDDELDPRVGRLHDLRESPDGRELYTLGNPVSLGSPWTAPASCTVTSTPCGIPLRRREPRRRDPVHPRSRPRLAASPLAVRPRPLRHL